MHLDRHIFKKYIFLHKKFKNKLNLNEVHIVHLELIQTLLEGPPNLVLAEVEHLLRIQLIPPHLWVRSVL